MRYVYPLLAVLSVLFFLVTTLVAAALLVAFPFLVMGAAALLILGRQVQAGIRLMLTVPRALESFLGAAAVLVGVVFNPLLEREGEQPEEGHGRAELPQLFAMIDEVAARVGTRTVDRVLLSPTYQLGVFEHGGVLLAFFARRWLVLGVTNPYLYTVDELRVSLAHELAHFSRGHATRPRVLFRFLRAMVDLLERIETPLNPLYWSTALSLKVVAAIYLPWSRLDEHDADRDSARAVGANHAVAALRRDRDEIPPAQQALARILADPRALPVTPSRLGEAAALAARRLSPARRKQLSLAWHADVLDYRHETHPPLPLRIAALRGLPDQPGQGSELAVTRLPDFQRAEEAFTRRLFGARTPAVSAARFVQALEAHEAQAPLDAPPAPPPMEYFGDAMLEAPPEVDPLQALRDAVAAADTAAALAAYRGLPAEPPAPSALHCEVGKLAVGAREHQVALQAFRAAAAVAASPEEAGRALVLAARLHGERLADAATAGRLYQHVAQRYPGTEAARFAQRQLAAASPSRPA